MNFMTKEIDAFKADVEKEVAAFEAWAASIETRAKDAIDRVNAALAGLVAVKAPDTAPQAAPAPVPDAAAVPPVAAAQ